VDNSVYYLHELLSQLYFIQVKNIPFLFSYLLLRTTSIISTCSYGAFSVQQQLSSCYRQL